MSKNAIRKIAQEKGVNVSFSGHTNEVFVKGPAKAVNSFVMKLNLLGKTQVPQKIVKG